MGVWICAARANTFHFTLIKLYFHDFEFIVHELASTLQKQFGEEEERGASPASIDQQQQQHGMMLTKSHVSPI